MDAGILNKFSAKELDGALLQFAVAECAVSQSFLELISAKDESETYKADGATSMAAWLSLKLGWSNRRASRAVKVARALRDLPLTREAYAQGRICWERVEALCCFVTPETEEELLEVALTVGASDLRGLLRSLKPVEVPDSKQAYEQRYLRWFWDMKTRMLNVNGALPEVEGAAFAKALEHLADKPQLKPGEPGERSEISFAELPDEPTFEQACADALIELCSSYLHTSAEAVRATVVIHAELDALKGWGTGIASLDSGPMISGETVLRMCCDGHSELVLEGPDHEPIGIGRRSRQVPGWLWRVLWHRDQGCRFPGCERQRWIQNHHIRHWTKNGPTDKENLVLLCWHHHHLVHEGGWQLKGDPDEWLDFISPAGDIVTSLPPPPLDPELRDRLFDTFSGDPPESETG
ncbi:MAG TPA: DUF222 domain-containing protein [Actinomycetota bacterium]|nr:DUF222 domain-containing protein [Actinomycetota bacterium]